MRVATAPRIEAAHVKQAVSLLELLPAECKPRRTGRDAYRARCPLHGGEGYTLAIRLAAHGWAFNCFACNTGGTVIDFAMRLYGLSFRDALMRLADGRTFDLTVTTPTKRHVAPLVLVCDGPGCLAFSEVEAEDVPYLGQTTRTSWHVGPVRSYCWRCAKARTGNGQNGPGLRVKTGVTHGRFMGC